MSAPTPILGSHVRDSLTGIDGQLAAITHWHDRSDEACIARHGVNHEGRPWEPHWFPVSRMEVA